MAQITLQIGEPAVIDLRGRHADILHQRRLFGRRGA
jgi:hypothetical protein